MKDTYPGPRTLSEATRLQVQHALVKDAFKGLLLGSSDLSKSNLRILDSCTADGFWMTDVRSQMADCETATFIGTDIADFPSEERSFEIPNNMHFQRQDIREEWPEEWKRTFDVVHQRFAMVNAGSMENAVKIIERLLALVKPGGVIVLVDGRIASPEDSEPPSTVICKAAELMMSNVGMNASIPLHLSGLFTAAIKSSGLSFINVGSAQGSARIGKGAEPTMEDTGYAWIRGLHSSLGGSFRKLPEQSSIPADQIDAKFFEMMEEAQTKGFDLPYFAAWARRAVS